MTNRQSNIIFYGVISLIIYALIINYAYPEFFEDLTKSKKELSIKEAMNEGENDVALTLYRQIVDERVKDDNEITAETAVIYEEMAKLNSLLGNQAEEKNYYLKSLSIKNKLRKNDAYAFANTYFKLGELAEGSQEYDQAQQYYEQALSKRLGNAEDLDEGFFVGMQNSRQEYLRLNNEVTIDIFKKLGSVHSIKQESAIAKTYYEKALAASKEIFEEGDARTLEISKVLNSLSQ